MIKLRMDKARVKVMSDQERRFGFEIDFLPVGKGEDSGDAICMRWGYDLCSDNPEQFVMIVDGGYKETGEELLEHIKNFYFNQGKLPIDIDMIISTHPHQDHISGLPPIIDGSAHVKWLVMHTPWRHDGLKKWFDDVGTLKEVTIHNKLKEGLSAAVELERLAKKNKIAIYEAFAPWKSRDFCGCRFYVLSPKKTYYEALLSDFNATPGNGKLDRGRRLNSTGRRVNALRCPLDEEGETSAENESSIILLIYIIPKDKYVLLTADGGKLALSHAIGAMKSLKIDVSNIDIFQVPHHGSVQNITPTILNVIMGVPVPKDARLFRRISIASVSANADDEHPADAVRNAILQRGSRFCTTAGTSKHFSYGAVPSRKGFIDIEYDNELSPTVQEYEV